MEGIKKAINVLFVLGIISFMLMGTAIVLGQLYSVIVLDGKLAIQLKGLLAKPTFFVAAVTGMLGFIQGYVNHWEMGD